MMSFDFMQQGGVMMWVILAIFISSTVFFIKRLLDLHRAQIKTTDFIRGIFNIVNKGNIVEAVSQCEETPGPVSQMVRMAILERENGQDRVRQVMQEVGLAEIPRLERGLGLLMSLAQLSPMAGLLGTVVGMMSSLSVMVKQSPQVYAGDLSSGLWTALLTTAFGLGTGMCVYFYHNLLVNRVESILLDMERVFGEVLFLMNKSADNGTNK